MRSCKTCRHTLGGEHCWGCNYSTGLHKWEPKPTTNADRIRSMTDEELADWLVMNGDGSDYQTHLAWLKDEVSE